MLAGSQLIPSSSSNKNQKISLTVDIIEYVYINDINLFCILIVTTVKFSQEVFPEKIVAKFSLQNRLQQSENLFCVIDCN